MTRTAADREGADLLQADKITAGYGREPVISQVSLSLRAGELVGLVGPNGCGKSTLLHCLTGYHPVTAGTIRLQGEQINGLSRAAVARHVAFVPQSTESVYGFSVLDMVLMGRFPYGGLGMLDTSEDLEQADAALARLSVQHLRDRIFTDLSGGERQLVLLARALVQQAPLVIMDEPLAALDLRHQFQVMQALQTMTQQPGCAALATFHDISAASRWCSRLILLRNGSILADGKAADVVTAENLLRLYNVEARVTPDDAGHLVISVRGIPS